MDRKFSPVFGVIIVVVVLGIGFLWANRGEVEKPAKASKPITVVNGYWGSDKALFLEDLQVKKILKEKGFEVAGKVKSQMTIEAADMKGQDFIWHSGRVSYARYKAKKLESKKDTVIFRSPLVVNAGTRYSDALEANGMVEIRDNVRWLTGYQRLVRLSADGATWEKDLGVPVYGQVVFKTTDLQTANSGLLTTVHYGTGINNNQPLTSENIDTIIPELKKYRQNIGLVDTKNLWLTGELIDTGVPMIETWESQLVEQALTEPGLFPKVKRDIRILYPVPTIWTEHVYTATTDNGVKLMEALQDPRLQKIGWEKHGLRTERSNTQKLPVKFKELGVADSIDSVLPIPTWDVIEKILNEVK